MEILCFEDLLDFHCEVHEYKVKYVPVKDITDSTQQSISIPIIMSIDSKPKRVYRPLDFDNIIEEFTNLDATNIDRVLEFVNTYGLISRDSKTGLPISILRDGILKMRRLVNLGALITEKEVAELYGCLGHYLVIQNGKLHSLAEMCREPKWSKFKKEVFKDSNMKTDVEIIHKADFYDQGGNDSLERISLDAVDNLGRNNTIGVARCCLTQELTRRLEENTVSFGVWQNPNGEYIPGFKTTSLVGAMYYQVLSRLFKDVTIKKCKGCDCFLFMRHGDRRKFHNKDCKTRYFTNLNKREKLKAIDASFKRGIITDHKKSQLTKVVNKGVSWEELVLHGVTRSEGGEK